MFISRNVSQTKPAKISLPTLLLYLA